MTCSATHPVDGRWRAPHAPASMPRCSLKRCSAAASKPSSSASPNARPENRWPGTPSPPSISPLQPTSPCRCSLSSSIAPAASGAPALIPAHRLPLVAAPAHQRPTSRPGSPAAEANSRTNSPPGPKRSTADKGVAMVGFPSGDPLRVRGLAERYGNHPNTRSIVPPAATRSENRSACLGNNSIAVPAPSSGLFGFL